MAEHNPLDDVTGDQNNPHVDPSTGLPYTAELGELGPEEKAGIAYGIEQAREHRMTPDTAEVPAPVILTRYHIHKGGQGIFSVQRTVDPSCDDWVQEGSEGKPGPNQYSENVCLCSSPFTALYIAKALEEKYPDGNIV